MTAIVIFALLGFVLFCCFLYIGLWDFPASVNNPPAVQAVRKMVKLNGLSLAGARVLSDDSDYRALLSHPALRETARKLRRDRQRLFLQWMRMLRNDLKELYRFRRFLVRCGADVGWGEELKILGAFLLALSLLQSAAFIAWIAGPFALRGATRRARRLVETMSYAPALALSRIPQTGWTELERNWDAGAA